jgi:hypothetical protein
MPRKEIVMKTNKLCFALSFLLLFAAGKLPGETYHIDSEEATTLRFLHVRAGRIFPFSSWPVHGSDLLGAAEKLSPFISAEDENPDRVLLERLIGVFSAQKDKRIILKGDLSASYEHRFRTSQVLADPSTVKNGVDVQRRYFSFDPVLSFGAGIGTFTGIYVEAEALLRQPWKDDYDPMNNFLFPLQGSEIDIGYEIISKGMLSWNGKYINAALGRDKVHFGSTLGSTLYPSRSLPFMDGLRLNIPIGPFEADYFLSTIQPRKALVDVTIEKDYFGFLLDPNPSIILNATHRFQWNFGRIKAGAGGNVVYARSNNFFLVTDFLPIIVYHNSDITPNNLSLILDFSWAFYPGFTLTGMLGFDDINASIFGIGDSVVPTIPAWIVQVEYALLAKPFRADFLLEGGYTHYLWGNFAYDGERKDKWGEVNLARAIYRYSANGTGLLLPLTSPYGPGVIWGRLAGSFYFTRLPLKVSPDLLLLAKLRDADLVNTEYKKDNALKDGNRLWYFSLDVPCVYTYKWFDFKIIPGLIIRDGNAAFECTIGFRFNLEGEKTF